MQSLDYSRPAPSPLCTLVDTAHTIRASAEQLDGQTSHRWTRQSTESLSRLTEILVSDLLPRLAATDSIVIPKLDTDLGNLLRDAHRHIRQLAERLAIVSEAMSRSRGRSDTRPAHDALVALTTAMDEIESVQQAALCRLESSLSESELAGLGESLEAAAAAARGQIVLITQPEPEPTDAYVLRRRPDLDRAYATNVDAAGRTSSRPRRPIV